MPANLGGDSLYNILKEAKGFDAKNLYYIDPVQQSAVPTSSITSFIDSNKYYKAINVTGIPSSENNKSILSDIFGRKLAPSSVALKKSGNTQSADQSAQEALTNTVNIREILGNSLIINYKNSISSNVSGSDVFYSKINKPMKNVSKFDAEFNPTINTIVSKLSTEVSPIPPLQLSYADFLYCKKLGNYPNNRLVILRRFNGPAADDLIESAEMNLEQSPISVMVTWFDEFPMQIDFGEKWKDLSTGLITQLITVGKELISGVTQRDPKFTATEDGATNEDIGNPWLSSLWYGFLDNQSENLGLKKSFAKLLPNANPNLIREAKYRAAKSLRSNISFTLKFEYVLRYLNGIDPHIAMHNILANIIRMGTSTSFYVYPKPTSLNEGVPQAINDLVDGNITSALQIVLDGVSNYLKKVSAYFESNPKKGENDTNDDKSITGVPENAKDTNPFEVSKDDKTTFQTRLLSLYRFKLIAAMQADTGLPSGAWHVTIGNPFNPIVTIGDLVIEDTIDLKFGKELSYNDFPTEISATVKLVSARNRGSQELEQIFNAGKGRIYVYPTIESNPDTFSGDNNNTKTDSLDQPTTSPEREKRNLANLVSKGIPESGIVSPPLPNLF